MKGLQDLLHLPLPDRENSERWRFPAKEATIDELAASNIPLPDDDVHFGPFYIRKSIQGHL